MTAEFKIMIWSWNADGVRLCETLSQYKAGEARKGFRGILKTSCVAPNFFENLRQEIQAKQPGLVVFTTQDESSSDTYFHSNFLPNTLSEIDYHLLKRHVALDIGEMTPVEGSSKYKQASLRISIYARRNEMEHIKLSELHDTSLFKKKFDPEVTCKRQDASAGGVALYLSHDIYGMFAFVALDLVSGVIDLPGIVYENYRKVVNAGNFLCLVKIMHQLVLSLPQNVYPDHVFLIGDFNSNIVVPNQPVKELVNGLVSNITATKLKDLQKYDELTQTMKDYPLIGYNEGPANNGPLFLPTSKLAKDRPASCNVAVDSKQTVDAGCFDTKDLYGGVGWRERILYKDTLTTGYITHCIEYNRFDIANMNASTQAGILGFYELRPIK